jgi:hypothetical protein
MKRRSFVRGLSSLPLLAPLSAAAGATERPQAPRGGYPPRGGIWIDLATARPAEALSPVPRRGRWRTVPWKARDGEQRREGTMLIVGSETGAPEITIDPQLEGPHDVYVGLCQFGFEGPSRVRVKLDNDPCYIRLENEVTEKSHDATHTRSVIQDCYVCSADLSGRRIQLAPRSAVDSPPGAMVAYIRAAPVSAASLERRKAKGLKRLVAFNDGHGQFHGGAESEPELWEGVLPFRGSGFSALYFGITGADHCNYPSRAGTLIGDDSDDFPRAGDRRYTQGVKSFLRRGIDPLESMKKMTRSLGLEFHVSIRMEAFALQPPYDGVFMSRFYAAHPELRCVDRDGRRISRLSYAFPEVREHMCAIVDEVLSYKPDGINFIFCRAQPFVLFEEPALAEFRRRHGSDPRGLPDGHPDAGAVSAHFMNMFMAEVRRRTRRLQGYAPELSAVVLSDRESNQISGLDVLHWVQQRWVDEVLPSIWNYRRWRTTPQVGYLVKACRANGCRIVVNLHAGELTLERIMPTALRYHQEGVDGFSIWDTETMQPTLWALLMAMGRIDRIAAGEEPPPSEPSVMQLTDLGDFVMDRYKSSWCF